MTNNEIIIRKQIEGCFDSSLKRNSDYTYNLNKKFRIDINISSIDDEDFKMTANLIEDSAFSLFEIPEIPVNGIYDVVYYLIIIASKLNLKVVTDEDEFLASHNGFITMDYDEFTEFTKRYD